MGSFLVAVGCILWVLIVVGGADAASKYDWTIGKFILFSSIVSIFTCWPFWIFGTILAFAN